jgi:hypothetical protein
LKLLFLLAGGTFATQLCWNGREQGGRWQWRRRHIHYLVRGAIRLQLKRVASRADFEVCLMKSGGGRCWKPRQGLNTAHRSRRKDGDFADIPRKRGLSASYRLIANALLEHVHVIDRRLGKPWRHNCRALESG